MSGNYALKRRAVCSKRSEYTITERMVSEHLKLACEYLGYKKTSSMSIGYQTSRQRSLPSH